MKDEWLRAALSDDTVVVELLFRLKQSSFDASTPVMPSKPPPPPPPPLHSWGQRLPRSKPPNTLRKDSTTTRFSPTTPLSWSDGGYDDSSVSRSFSDLSSASRSKGYMSTNEAANTPSINTRSTKKKRTFAELKEEQNILLKASTHLKRELASLHVTLKEQTVTSENLKRIKFDLNLQSSETGSTFGVVSKRCYEMEPAPANCALSALSRHTTKHKRAAMSNYCEVEEVETNERQQCFILPDLNMTPTEEEVAAQVL